MFTVPAEAVLRRIYRRVSGQLSAAWARVLSPAGLSGAVSRSFAVLARRVRTDGLPVWWARSAGGAQVFENEQKGLRYRLPGVRIDEDTRFLIVRAIRYPDDSVEEFIQFLYESVVQSPDGRVSARKLWHAWAARHSVDSAAETEDIAGVNRADIIEHFRDAFDVGEQVRRRLDGEVQWVWLGYELNETGGVRAALAETLPAQLKAVERASETDDPDIEGVPLKVELFGRTKTGKWRYRIRGDGVSGDLYTEADDESPPPRLLELIIKPKGEDER